MSTQQRRQEWRELAAYMCGLTVKAATYDTSAGYSIGVVTGFEASWDHATGRAIALEMAIAATAVAVPALLADVDALTQERDAANVSCKAALRDAANMRRERDALAAELERVRAQLDAVPVDAIKGYVASTAHMDISRGAERYADAISAWTARMVRYAVSSQV